MNIQYSLIVISWIVYSRFEVFLTLGTGENEGREGAGKKGLHSFVCTHDQISATIHIDSEYNFVRGMSVKCHAKTSGVLSTAPPGI